ncbi:MAG: hypothetical protein KatS3mg003_1072 [Candidatus Nitrosocaldaceae archaeon]|nr:MAG: hypothetical protein KatS3mg003_1072 [Candidatus Nitrosocaldaceae archaeon]
MFYNYFMPLMVGFDNEYNNLDDLVEDFTIKYKDKETLLRRSSILKCFLEHTFIIQINISIILMMK